MDIADEVLTTLRRLIRATDLHSKHLTKTVGLTAPQLLLLQIIDRNGKLSISDIAKHMSLSQATVTTIVDRLQNRDFLLREKSTLDKRKVFVVLTAKGKSVLKNSPTALQSQLVRQLNKLDHWEQSMILSSLQRVASMMDAEKIDASPILDVGELDRGVEHDR